MQTSNALVEVVSSGNRLDLRTEGARFQVYFLREDIIRIRSTFDEEFPPEQSYALVTTAWPDANDEVLADERVRIEPLPIRMRERDRGGHASDVSESAGADVRIASAAEPGGGEPEAVPEGVVVGLEELKRLEFTTGALTLRVNPEPFNFTVLDAAGNVLHQDVPGRSFVRDGNGRVVHYSKRPAGRRFYGFGEKSGPFNKVKQRMRMHNTDTLGWDPLRTDPLYKMIPFYIALDSSAPAGASEPDGGADGVGGVGGVATGFFYHNSYDSSFDLGKEHSNYWPHYSHFTADGGEIDLFLIAGPTIRDVVRGFTDLTGKSALMPIGSLGFTQCSMVYGELDADADAAIVAFIERCRALDIPIDHFELASGYTSSPERKRHFFTWNYTRFPDPAGWMATMKELGILVTPNIKPGILHSHPLVGEFADAGAFVKAADGVTDQTDEFWGGPSHYVDFTSPEGRAEWTRHMKRAIFDVGITAVWNDNNEYEINDGTARVSAEGYGGTIAEYRSVMSSMMAKTAREAMREYNPDLRPFVVTRAGYTGLQRYAQTWAGDNYTSWDSLKYNIATLLGMGLSGVANYGADIGGFAGPAPEPELLVRWVQNGAFQPRFMMNSSSNDNTVTEPMMYPSYTPYVRDAIKLRYSLTPYYYSLLREASQDGAPIMRPLVYEFQGDPAVEEEGVDFMVGRSLLVANVVEKRARTRSVYLPRGTSWVNWETRERYDGGTRVELDVDLASIPMFFRAGAIIPMSPGLTSIHREPITQVHVLVEPSEEADFVLYEDDGVSNAYERGEFLETTISVRHGDGVDVRFGKAGPYVSRVESFVVDVVCPEAAPFHMYLDGRELPVARAVEDWDALAEGWYYDGEKRRALVKFANPEGSFTLNVDTGIKDLIGM